MEILQYDFFQRGIIAGVIIALTAPLIGIFLVLRRYSLIADTLAHVSLTGVAIAFLTGINPIFSVLGTTVIASLAIEKLRTTKKVYGESALALFLSASVALATVLLSFGRGFNSNLFNYLFGSIVTVTKSDIHTIIALALIVAIVVYIFYKELIYITFDEESAKVSGVPTSLINGIFILLTAVTIALSIPIIGVLLISALMVIPVISALQLRVSFIKTIIYSEIISVLSVITGILVSFYFNLSTGGTIVLVMFSMFLVIFFHRNYLSKFKR